MRKAQKQQIEETIRQMEEAHDELKMYIEKRIIVQAKELLADCQNAAVAIGTLIENTEGEGHPAVMVLEEYCEQVYQIHEYLSSDCNVNTNKIYKSLRQKLIKASNSIRNDIKIRTEAVFLPYKASMWDSLESVWKAADADPDCDAYVIPIPYFDKNPDGSFREMHYEGGQYPNYVPTTRYDAFDFGKHMPDVIYIHNAYDDWNLVTSVHPDFYSKNLKKYTDKLVYIPYFVLSEIDSDNEQAAEGMKHFCFMPGIINADKVIVQSENMKKIYVREYLKAAKKYGLTGKHLDKTYLDKKFLGTGSPKFDKVLNTKKEDLEIPAEWLKVIEKPDGSWKKIIFYNNSIGALLQHSEKMLRKMESVFEIFKENKDEVALLWRPHPLIQATIESMRPQLWEGYKEIRDRYVEEGWGIYDDSADVDRAVVLSDAYYGDGSSVVQLCRKQYKTVLFQDVDYINEDEEQFFLSSNVCCFIQDKIVLISEATNLVAVFSQNDWRVKGMYAFQDEMYVQSLCISAFCVGSNMISIPYCAQDFRVIDVITGAQKSMAGYISDSVWDIKEKFLISIICDQHVWIIGEKIKRFIGITMDSLMILADISFSSIHGIEDIADKITWGYGYIVKGHQIFLAGRNYGVILEINNLSQEFIVRTRTKIEGFSFFYEYDDKMFLLDHDGNEYLYDYEKYCIQKTDRKFNEACWKCIVVNQKRYYFEAFSGKIFLIYKDSMEEISYESRQNLARRGVKFQFVELSGKTIYFQERFSGQIFALETDFNKCVWQKVDVSSYMKLWRKSMLELRKGKNNMCYEENGFISLGSLLEYLKCGLE